MAKNLYFYLQPRYTAGSSAAVWDEALAHRVAREEQGAYQGYLEGVFGPADQAMAQQRGLAGIAEARYEKGRGVMVRDLITGKTYFREKKAPGRLDARDQVIRIKDESGNVWEGCYGVEDVIAIKSDHRVHVRLKGMEHPVTLWYSDEVEVQREVESFEFKYEV